MSVFVSHSQVGQDTFAYEQIGVWGTFLDIGSNDPVRISNSFALEQSGWRGLAVDADAKMVDLFRSQRNTPVILADALQIYWKLICAEHQLGPVIDYLSLDIDGNELLVLQHLVMSGLRFRVITCEHNRYIHGDGPRNAQREFLLAEHYKLVRPDVTDQGLEFEDWWTL